MWAEISAKKIYTLHLLTLNDPNSLWLLLINEPNAHWPINIRIIIRIITDFHSPKKIFFFICFKDSPPKMMKNAFYLILKIVFVLRILKCLPWLFGHLEKTAPLRPVSSMLIFQLLLIFTHERISQLIRIWISITMQTAR